MRRELDDSLTYEKHKEHQSQYLAKVAELERDILSRTVFVTQAKDLNQDNNLRLLRAFFETRFGPVEECIRAKFTKQRNQRNGRFPPARVRFYSAADAEKIFGGKKLLQALQDRDVEKIPEATVGYKRWLTVRPSERYHGMVDNILSDSEITINSSSFSVGHWFPESEDSYFASELDDSSPSRLRGSQFLEEAVHNSGTLVKIDLKKRTVHLEVKPDLPSIFSMFGLSSQFQSASHVISFRFKELEGVIELCSDAAQANSYSFIFRLKHPPKIYYTIYNPHIDREVSDRCIDIPGMTRDIFGTCFSYKMCLSRHQAETFLNNDKILGKLRSFGILRNNLFSIEGAEVASTIRIGKRSGSFEAHFKTIDEKSGLLLRSLFDTGKLCWYHALHDTVDNNGVMQNIFGLLSSSVRPAEAHRAINQMIGMHRETRVPARLLKFLLSALEEREGPTNAEGEETAEEHIPSYCMELTRALVTPTREAVSGFCIEMSNRVVRHFVTVESFSSHYFLRVSIGDENGGRLFSDDLSQAVCARIKELILDGLNINGRDYRFLAYSSSQLKELSLWMVHCPYRWNGWDIASMRAWMGDFSKCKTPSKYAARMGQCFSTTVQTTEATKSVGWASRYSNRPQLQVDDKLSDILCHSTDNKEMCHSDGTGLIRKEAMVDLVRKLPFAPRNVEDVSIIQIGFGGAKGTLTAWDINALKSNGALSSACRADVLLRPSMVKFKASYRHLEVISIGKHVPYYLNRHVLLLLGVHQVPDITFLRMQEAMLDNLNNMLECGNRAAEMLPRLGGADSSVRSTLSQMISLGLSPAEEPFLFSCAHAIRSHHLMQLRKKSRIFVEKGAVLMGGLDESRLLPEGCVFVQLRISGLSPDTGLTGKESSFRVLTGPVMVTKHPVLHPGGVRMLLAVDIPELRSHKNTILFSQHGTRPEADKMSGSDLDGDEFAVYWDERLFLTEWNCCQKLSNYEWTSRAGKMLSLRQNSMELNAKLLNEANRIPLKFDSQGEAPQFDHIEDTDLIDHFINYAKSDNLGRICTLWLDYAAAKGADCDECVELAKLSSVAVDFPKTGIPAELPRELTIPRDAPRAHWREIRNVEAFQCESIVGKLCNKVVAQMKKDKTIKRQSVAMAGRSCDRHGQISCFMDRENSQGLTAHLMKLYMPHIPERLGLSMPACVSTSLDQECDALLMFSVEERLDYEEELTSTMNRYKIYSEGELITGCIRKYHKLHKRRQHNHSEELRRQARKLRSKYRTSFFTKVLQLVCPDCQTFRDGVGDDFVDEQERIDQELIEEVVKAVTERVQFPHNSGEQTFSVEQVHNLRVCSRKLAAAYYVVTYHPKMRWRAEHDFSTRPHSGDTTPRVLSEHNLRDKPHGVALFSFPWILSDVMECAFSDRLL